MCPNAVWPDQLFGNQSSNNGTQASKWNPNVYVRPYKGLDGQRGDSVYRSRKSIASALTLIEPNTNSRIIFMSENDPGVTPANTTDYYAKT